MAKQQKFPEIIERVEYVRRHLAMSKSYFSERIGMLPQTYNNFIGPQGSKPNIELIFGLFNVYHVNPYWLLNGTGEIFLKPPPDRRSLIPLPGRGGEPGKSSKRLPRLRKKNVEAG